MAVIAEPKQLTISGITLVKTKKGIEIRVPTSINEDSLREWKEKNKRAIKQFKNQK